MALLSYLTELIGPMTGVARTASAEVANVVKVKAAAGAPETPMAGARVRLHRPQDGACAWQGLSDADGQYRAGGLEPGLVYVPLAIDLGGTYECVAAGPVVAARVPRFAPDTITVVIGQPLAVELHLTGVDEPAAVVLAAGALPSGVGDVGRFLSASAPTGAPGAYSATYSVTSAGATMPVVLNINLVLLPLQLSGSATPGFSLGFVMAPITFAATGGEPAYTFGVSGTLPTGISFDAATATLSGTPTTAPEAYNFTVTVTDVRGASTSLNYSGAVSARGSGYILASAYASVGLGVPNSAYDPSTYPATYAGAYTYGASPRSTVTKTVSPFTPGELWSISGSNGNYVGDSITLDIEFLSGATVVAAAAVKRTDNFKNVLHVGPSLAALTAKATTGTYPQTDGTFSANADGFSWTPNPDRTSNTNAFTYPVNLSSVDAVRFSVAAVANQAAGGASYGRIVVL